MTRSIEALTWLALVPLLGGVALVGCSRGAESASDDTPAAAASHGAPLVTPDGGHLVLTWVDEDGDFQVATTVSGVPEDRRSKVRVQDPEHPPPDPDTVWLADLREASSGAFPVRSAKRAEFEGLSRPRPAATTKAPSPAPTPRGAAERSHVVMYVTSTCPVCRRARRWLTQNDISFVERDVGRDQGAARELREQAAQQGVRADGVPVFDVRGKLIPGFDQGRLRRELGL